MKLYIRKKNEIQKRSAVICISSDKVNTKRISHLNSSSPQQFIPCYFMTTMYARKAKTIIITCFLWITHSLFPLTSYVNLCFYTQHFLN